MRSSVSEPVGTFGVENAEYFDDFDIEDFVALGIDPLRPTAAKPGSEEKVVMLAARYAAGLPLWHGDDCYDHGPGSVGNLVVEGEFGEFGEGEEEDVQ